MNIEKTNTTENFNSNSISSKALTTCSMYIGETLNRIPLQNLQEKNMTIFNNISKNIFNMTSGRNLFSRAEKDSLDTYCMAPMQIFTYLFSKRNTMTVIPNNMKGTIMKLERNLLRASTILALSTLTLQTFADAEPVKPSVTTSENPSVKTGWQPYVGGSMGYGRMSAANKWSQNLVVGAPDDSGKSNFNSKGFLGAFHVGIQKSLTPTIKLGGEFYGFLENHKASVEHTTSESLKREDGVGAKVKLGYVFDTHSAVYVHGGVEKTGFHYGVNYTGVSGKSKKYLWGAPFGVGVETSLNSKWTAKLEYTHTVYQSWNTGTKTLGGATSKAKISASHDSISMGLSYNF